MNNWFECKVSFDKVSEEGLMKKVTEAYLVDALSFTEAEERITKEMQPFVSGEFTVSNIKRARIAELFTAEDEESDKWYRCKVLFVSLDENKGIERKVPATMMVQAVDMQSALANLLHGMRGTMADYEIAAIVETLIMDVYPFEVKDSSAVEF